jgi:hypothetical protein
MSAADNGHGAVVELLMRQKGVELSAVDKVSELLAYYWRVFGGFVH